MATKAQQVDFLLSPVREPGSGVIVNDGRVFFYSPGTTTPVTVYQNRNKTVTAANPFALGSDGTGLVFIDGTVDIVIKRTDGYGEDRQDMWRQINSLSGITCKAVPDPVEMAYEDGGWTTLNEALAAIGATETDLKINSNVGMTADLVVPTTCRILPTRKGYINHGVHTLTINSTFERGRVRVFLGAGAVVFGQGTIEQAFPEWFSGTGGVKEAVAAAGSVAPISLSGKKTYAENSPIVNTSTRSIKIIGKVGERNDGTYNGSAITTTYNGVLFRNGTDSGNAWDANEYDGPQGFEIENVYLAYTGSTTAALQCGGGNYGTGTTAFEDWRGGHIRLRNVVFANFDYAFWGIQSDFNRFENVQVRSCKRGIYAGPRSDQFIIDGLYASFCDQAVQVDNAEVQMTGMSLVGCGYQGTYPIEVLQVTAVNRLVTIKEPQLERYQSASYINAFIGIGVNAGYNGGSGAPRVEIDGVQFWTNVQASPNGYAKYVVEIGKGIVDMEVVTGDIANIDHIVSWVGAHGVADAICRLVGFDNIDSKSFVNNGSGSKTQLLDTYGSGGTTTTMSVNQRIYRKFGADLQSYAMVMAVDGRWALTLPDSGTDNTSLLQLERRRFYGLVAAPGNVPTSGSFDPGDSFTVRAPVSGQPWEYVVATGGTYGTYAEGRTATTDGTINVVLSATSAVLKIGQYVTINSTTRKILTINGTAVTLDGTIAAASGQAIAFAAPTLKNTGNLS